jgi:hypothetical protein
MNQLTVDVSVLELDVITKLVPAVTVPTLRNPCVPLALVYVKNILEFAVTAVFVTVTVPATNVAFPTMAAPDVVPTRKPEDAVIVFPVILPVVATILPADAVILPVVAVIPVPAVIGPAVIIWLFKVAVVLIAMQLLKPVFTLALPIVMQLLKFALVMVALPPIVIQFVTLEPVIVAELFELPIRIQLFTLLRLILLGPAAVGPTIKDPTALPTALLAYDTKTLP